MSARVLSQQSANAGRRPSRNSNKRFAAFLGGGGGVGYTTYLPSTSLVVGVQPKMGLMSASGRGGGSRFDAVVDSRDPASPASGLAPKSQPLMG